MKNINKKTKISTIILLTLLAISTSAFVFQPAFSQAVEQTKTTFAFINATPNPVGVNQEVLLHVGIPDFLRDVDEGWEGLTVTVTKPDGTTETLGPYKTDSTGGTGAIYVPTMVGSYFLKTNFPEQTYFWTPNFRAPFTGLVLYEASESEELELIVNQEPRTQYPTIPQPTEYWTRPIDPQFREWASVAGNWLEGAGGHNHATVAVGNSEAPDTPHILWATPLDTGGLAGANLEDHAMEDGDAYWGKFSDAVIVAGILCYNEYSTGFGPVNGIHKVSAINLRTGEKLWSKVLGDNERISFAQLLLWDTFNYHGVFPYIWTTPGGGVYKAYNPLTGDWEYTMENVPGGARTFGSKGEILIYNVNTNNGYMTLWNSSNIPALYNGQTDPSDPNYGTFGFGGFGWGSWYARGKTVDATGDVTVYPNQPLGKAGYSWNVSIPTSLYGNAQSWFAEDMVLGANINRTEVSSWALSLKKGQEGQLLFQNTWQAPAEWESDRLDVSYAAPVSIGHFAAWDVEQTTVGNVFVVWVKETRTYYGFSMVDGSYLWETDPEHYLNLYIGTNRAMGNGKLYSVGYSGTVYCYDLATGIRQWEYDANDIYNEILWGNNWPLRIQFITDGKIYVGMEEHSSVDPKPRGAPYFALDAETGDLIWRLDGGLRQTHWGGNSIIGDSVIATMDTYDQQIYAVGKGPSLTTVTTPNVGAQVGSALTISGSVMDVSPGIQDANVKLRFPNGVPAVSDDSMSDWMLYVYKQFPKPMAAGVQVKLEAYDPNGNYQNLGTVTTDSYGNYGFSYEPEVPGTYYIFATFEGTNAYYGSSSSAYFSSNPAPTPATPIEPEVPEEPETPTEPEEPETPTEPEEPETPTEPEEPETPTEPEQPAETPLITTEIAIVIAVAAAAVIGVGAFWALRKRQ